MVSLGVWSGATERLPVTREMFADGYVIADVSAEQLDGVVTHSGQSLARGVLPW